MRQQAVAWRAETRAKRLRCFLVWGERASAEGNMDCMLLRVQA